MTVVKSVIHYFLICSFTETVKDLRSYNVLLIEMINKLWNRCVFDLAMFKG